MGNRLADSQVEHMKCAESRTAIREQHLLHLRG